MQGVGGFCWIRGARHLLLVLLLLLYCIWQHMPHGAAEVLHLAVLHQEAEEGCEQECDNGQQRDDRIVLHLLVLLLFLLFGSIIIHYSDIAFPVFCYSWQFVRACGCGAAYSRRTFPWARRVFIRFFSRWCRNISSLCNTRQFRYLLHLAAKTGLGAALRCLAPAADGLCSPQLAKTLEGSKLVVSSAVAAVAVPAAVADVAEFLARLPQADQVGPCAHHHRYCSSAEGVYLLLGMLLGLLPNHPEVGCVMRTNGLS